MTYEVVYDPKVQQRLDSWDRRRNWTSWLYYGLWRGLIFSILGYVIFLVAEESRGRMEDGTRSYICVLIAFLGGVILTILSALQEHKHYHDPFVGEVWTCEIGETHWKTRTKAGVTYSIPWSIMRIKREHPDAWIVGYEGQELTVYREPLRAAGLEDEFRRRVKTAEPHPLGFDE